MLIRGFFILLCLIPNILFASTIDGSSLSIFWTLPFVFFLLSIALGPLVTPKIWHAHYGKISFLTILAFIIPFIFAFGFSSALHIFVHSMVEEYIPFILLLLALYTISGGILFWGKLKLSAKTNVAILAIGAILASIMGTTGAAMLLIRPILRTNENRKHKVHVVVFFIFLVANIGGGLTPLGDPPLFLGFLKGVEFTWTLQHMFLPVLMNTVILLLVFYCVDSYLLKQNDEIVDTEPDGMKDKFALFGKLNIVLLAGVVGAILLSGIWKSSISISILGTTMHLQDIVRDVILISLTVISLLITPKQVRAGNEFTWGPIVEVAKIFIAIFITLTPVIAMLHAGSEGVFKPIVLLAQNANGEPISAVYFWLTGLLSGFLDNAPTYLLFFNMASGDATLLMGEMSNTLLAISSGSVFMGALTYIGNAPNFMVKSIAEERKVKMPSFFGYMLWSFAILTPLFILQTLIFF